MLEELREKERSLRQTEAEVRDRDGNVIGWLFHWFPRPCPLPDHLDIAGVRFTMTAYSRFDEDGNLTEIVRATYTEVER